MKHDEKINSFQIEVKRENVKKALNASEIELTEKILDVLCEHEMRANSFNIILDICKSIVNHNSFLNEFEMSLVQQIVNILCENDISVGSANHILNKCRGLLLYNPTISFKLI